MKDENKIKNPLTGELVQSQMTETERKRADEASRDSEQQCRALIENALDAIAILNPDITIRYESPSMERLTGREAKSRIGKNPFEYCHPDDTTKVADEFIQLFENQVAVAHTELRLRHINGEWRTFELVGTNLIDDPLVAGIVLNLRDITERKQMEDQLLASEEKLRRVFDAIEYAIVISDLQGNIVDENEAALRYQGYSSKEEVIGKSGFEFITERDRGRAIQEAMDSIERGYGSIEVKFQDKDGNEYDAEANATTIRDGSGNPVGFATITRDITERKRAEEALRESEERFRSLVENAPYMIIIADREGKILFINYTTSGFTVEDTIGTSVFDYIPVEYHDEMSRSINGVFESEELAAFEIAGAGPDGTTSWYSVRVGPIMHDGQVIAVTLITLDITERKRAEDKLRKSEERYRDLVEREKDIIYTLDTNGNITSASAAVSMLGYETEQIIGKNFVELIPREWHEKTVGDFYKLLETGEITAETVLLDKKGEPHFVEYSSTVIREDDKVVGTRGIARDITQRKRAEQTLRESEEKLRGMFESIGDGIIVSDLKGRIIEENEAALRLQGYSNREEVIGKNGLEFIAEKDRSRATKDMRKALKLGYGLAREYKFVDKEGREFDGDASAALLHDSSGNPAGFISLIRDITDRKQVEDKLRRYSDRLRGMAAKLSATEEEERQRLAQELHDQVGQNLTALGINCSMIRTQLPEEAAASVGSILDDSQSLVQHTSEIIRDLMANLRPPVLEDYGVMAALRWYADRFAKRTGIAVTVQGEEPSPRLSSPFESALFRIAQEALTNAAKHSQASQITVIMVVEKGTLRLIITDDGIGFDTADAAMSNGQLGWGLLMMSERARSMGGSFSIKSRPGHGTRVVTEIGL